MFEHILFVCMLNFYLKLLIIMNFWQMFFSEEEARQSMLYSYKNSINGFAALLSDEEADILSGEQLIDIILLSHLRIVI